VDVEEARTIGWALWRVRDDRGKSLWSGGPVCSCSPTPRSFVVVQSVSDTVVPAPAGPVVSVPLAQVCGDLLELLGG
jgi:hypothetical protein